MIGKLICKLPRWLGGGHRRGKRVPDNPLGEHSAMTGHIIYRCPRCGATWRRKVKKEKKA